MQSIGSVPRTWFKIIWFSWACNVTLCEPTSQQQWARRLWSRPELCEKTFIRRHWRVVWIQNHLWKNLRLYRSDLAIFCWGLGSLLVQIPLNLQFYEHFQKKPNPPYLDSKSYLVDKNMLLWIMQDKLFEHRSFMYGCLKQLSIFIAFSSWSKLPFTSNNSTPSVC